MDFRTAWRAEGGVSAGGLTAPPRVSARLSDVSLYGGLFATAVAAFCLTQAMGHRFGAASSVVAVLGDATCGWSWLLVRALFQPPGASERGRAWRPLMLVLALVGAGAFLRLTTDLSSAAPRMVDNLSGLVSSALLLLAAVEPLKGLGAGVSASERGFRIGFAASYATILAVAVIWVNGAPGGSWAARWGEKIKTVCALVALVGMDGPSGGVGTIRWQRPDAAGRSPARMTKRIWASASCA